MPMLFFMLPSLAVIAVYLLAALLPAIFLMRYINKKDRLEQEPPRLLASLAFLGVAAALAAMALEFAGEGILSSLLTPGSPEHSIVSAFLVVAAAEEGAKLLFLKLRTWKNPNFDFRFDGIVYAAFISLGFAAFENILYVFGYGLSVSLSRAVLAIPGHLGFSVFMGLFYSRAKLAENRGNKPGKALNLALAYISAVFLHGFYDACAMIGTVLSTVLFIAFVAIMYIVVIRIIKKESDGDWEM